MNWHSDGGRAEEKFPFERWSEVFSVMPLHAADAAHALGYEKTAIFSTRYWLGYMAGFPGVLTEVNKELVEQTRRALFDGLYGDEGGETGFRRFASLFLARDLQTVIGLSSGMADGKLFFGSVERGEDPYGAANFPNLFSDIRSGKVDYS